MLLYANETSSVHFIYICKIAFLICDKKKINSEINIFHAFSFFPLDFNYLSSNGSIYLKIRKKNFNKNEEQYFNTDFGFILLVQSMYRKNNLAEFLFSNLQFRPILSMQNLQI